MDYNNEEDDNDDWIMESGDRRKELKEDNEKLIEENVKLCLEIKELEKEYKTSLFEIDSIEQLNECQLRNENDLTQLQKIIGNYDVIEYDLNKSIEHIEDQLIKNIVQSIFENPQEKDRLKDNQLFAYFMEQIFPSIVELQRKKATNKCLLEKILFILDNI